MTVDDAEQDSALLRPCGHEIPWDPVVLMDAKACPQCQQAIARIEYGDINATESVIFKFAKHTYHLSLQPTNKSTTKTRNRSNTPTRATWWWSNLWERYSSPHPVSIPQRLQYAFGLEPGFKIIYKGKRLYPPSTNSATTTDQTHGALEDIAQQEVQRLKEQQKGDSSKFTFKPSLVLMGTLSERKLQPPPHTKTTTGSTLTRVLAGSLSIVYYTLHASWLLVKTMLEPFLGPMAQISNRREPSD